MYVHYNNNPLNKSVGDCVIRAISKAQGQSWDRTYIDLAVQGMSMKDLMSSNPVWAAYLHKRGFKQYALNDYCPDCYTLRDFCRDYPEGIFIVGTGTHAICVIDGDYYDSWDSGSEVVTYYFWR